MVKLLLTKKTNQWGAFALHKMKRQPEMHNDRKEVKLERHENVLHFQSIDCKHE